MNQPVPSNIPELSGTDALVPAAAMGPGVAIELGISGMPEFSSDMICGGLYALNVRTSSARFPLLSSSLQSAINAGLPCTIVTASAPEELLHRLSIAGGFSSAELLADGRLNVFSMQDEFPKKIFRYGADRLVQELEDFEVPEGSYLLFEQADDLLSLHDVSLASQQIKILAQWFKRRNITGLMAFSRSNEQKLETLNTLLDYLTGLARLGGDRDGLEITFLYWRSTPGVIAARNFRLYTTDKGQYAVSRREVERQVNPEDSEREAIPTAGSDSEAVLQPRRQSPIGAAAISMASMPAGGSHVKPIPVGEIIDAGNPVILHALDAKHCYFYADPELDSLKGSVPGEWRLVQGTEKMLYASHDQPTAMIFLNKDLATDAMDLAKSVHILRKTLGLSAYILIREKVRSVTENQKQLLLQSGANLVISKEVTLEHYPKLINAVRSQTFSRNFDPDFDTIVASLPPEIDIASELEEPIEMPSYSYPVTNHSKSEPIAQRAIAKAKRSSLIS
jgi:hypothetical protein